MMSFITDKSKIITSNKSKNLKQVSLKLRGTNQSVWINYNKELICHISNI
jgi:hypothetical protein